MSMPLLLDETVGNPKNITKTDIDVAYIKTQVKIFNDLIYDLHKMMEENRLKRVKERHQYLQEHKSWNKRK